jgi:hypothetical protein
VSVFLRHVGPQLAGDRAAAGAAAQAQVGDQSLGAPREVGHSNGHPGAASFEREAIEQRDARSRDSIHGESPLVVRWSFERRQAS